MLLLLLWLTPGSYALTEDNFQVMGDVTRFAFYGMAMVMLFLGPLVRFKSGSLAALWMLISYLLYMRWLGAVSIDCSSYFYAFTGNSGKSTNPRDAFGIHRGKTISQWRMNYYGVEDASFLRNSEQLLLALLVLSVLMLLALLLGYSNPQSCLQALRKKVRYSLLILGVLFTYEDLLIYALLQVQQFQIDTVAAIISSISSVFFLLFAGIMILFVPIITYKHLKSVRSVEQLLCEKWLVLVEGTKPDMAYIRYQYYTVYLVQRAICAGVIVFLYSVGSAQAAVLLGTEILVLAWLIYARPYTQSAENVLVCLLQAVVCLLVLFESFFLISWSDEEQMFLTVAYVSVYWAGIGVCLVRFAVGLYGSKVEEEAESDQTKTEVVMTDSKHEVKVIDLDERIKSQLPNDYYDKMPRGLIKPGQKASNRVAPLSEAQELNRRLGWISQDDSTQVV